MKGQLPYESNVLLYYFCISLEFKFLIILSGTDLWLLLYFFFYYAYCCSSCITAQSPTNHQRSFLLHSNPTSPFFTSHSGICVRQVSRKTLTKYLEAAKVELLISKETKHNSYSYGTHSHFREHIY